MTALIVFLWIANMLVDTGGQLFFKAAASEHTAGAGGLAHWKRMASRPWLWFGICCYVLEFFVWMASFRRLSFPWASCSARSTSW